MIIEWSGWVGKLIRYDNADMILLMNDEGKDDGKSGYQLRGDTLVNIVKGSLVRAKCVIIEEYMLE